MMKCIRFGEKIKGDDDLAHSSDSLATRDYSATASGYSSRTAEVDTKVNNSNIEEAESSLRESGYLNYEVHFYHFICVFLFLHLMLFLRINLIIYPNAYHIIMFG